MRGGERGLEALAALRRDAYAARDIGDRVGGEALVLMRDRHSHGTAGKSGEIL